MSSRTKKDRDNAETNPEDETAPGVADETGRDTGDAADRPDDPNAIPAETSTEQDLSRGGPPFTPSTVTPHPGVPEEALTAPDPEQARADLPDGQYHPGATQQQYDPTTGTRTADGDPVFVSNDALLQVNLSREERVVLLEGIGALFTLHGRGEYAGDRPLPEHDLRALGDKLRGIQD